MVVKHALRNALIAPFTVIMLQFPWLLTGVVIVETMFRYQGFGYTLVEAAGNNDIDLLLGCSLVVGVHRPDHAADLRRRLRLSQPAHPGSVGALMEYVGSLAVIARGAAAVLAGLGGAG